MEKSDKYHHITVGLVGRWYCKGVAKNSEKWDIILSSYRVMSNWPLNSSIKLRPTHSERVCLARISTLWRRCGKELRKAWIQWRFVCLLFFCYVKVSCGSGQNTTSVKWVVEELVKGIVVRSYNFISKNFSPLDECLWRGYVLVGVTKPIVFNSRV